MPASIGINLRVTGHCRQGGRKYMEDFFSVAYQQTEDERDLEYAFFGIYDGHGGAEAAAYAKEHLMDTIVKHKSFWSENDDDVLKAIKDGYIATHYAMWKEQEKWPKTAAGLPSTAGTTASVAFIRRGKIYIGHVGDSGIILGYQTPDSHEWKAKPLTKDHKPENAAEMTRIESCGGKVVSKSGVPRVVWNRPRIGHKGPVRRSTPIDEIPFLAVARSLGDLWSYNSQLDEFVVSPEPDCTVVPIDTNTFRCLIFGTDGLYNMLSAQATVSIVQTVEKHNENIALSDSPTKGWLNPSKCLVERALERWSSTKMRADNTSVVTIMLDPPGPPRAQVLKNRKKSYVESGLEIMTRYNEGEPQPSLSSIGGKPTLHSNPLTSSFSKYDPALSPSYLSNIANTVDRLGLAPNLNNLHSRFTEIMQKTKSNDLPSCSNSSITPKPTLQTPKEEGLSDLKKSNYYSQSDFEQFERQYLPKLRESTSFEPQNPDSVPPSPNVSLDTSTEDLLTAPQPVPCSSTTPLTPTTPKDENIQINEISSSSSEAFDSFEETKEKTDKKTYKSASKTCRVMGVSIKNVLQPRTTVENSENIQLKATISTVEKVQPNESPKMLVNQENTKNMKVKGKGLQDKKNAIKSEVKPQFLPRTLRSADTVSNKEIGRILKPKNQANKKTETEIAKSEPKNDQNQIPQPNLKVNIENTRNTRSGQKPLLKQKKKKKVDTKTTATMQLAERPKRTSRTSKIQLILQEIKANKRVPKVRNIDALNKAKLKRLQPKVILERLNINAEKVSKGQDKPTVKIKPARNLLKRSKRSSKETENTKLKVPHLKKSKSLPEKKVPARTSKRTIIKKIIERKVKEAVVKSLEKKKASNKKVEAIAPKVMQKVLPLSKKKTQGPVLKVQSRPLRKRGSRI